jgi:hypothetical protein
MESSLLQWLGVGVKFQSDGKSRARWHLSVFPQGRSPEGGGCATPSLVTLTNTQQQRDLASVVHPRWQTPALIPSPPWSSHHQAPSVAVWSQLETKSSGISCSAMFSVGHSGHYLRCYNKRTAYTQSVVLIAVTTHHAQFPSIWRHMRSATHSTRCSHLVYTKIRTHASSITIPLYHVY